jgi:hypothetical protein
LFAFFLSGTKACERFSNRVPCAVLSDPDGTVRELLPLFANAMATQRPDNRVRIEVLRRYICNLAISDTNFVKVQSWIYFFFVVSFCVGLVAKKHQTQTQELTTQRAKKQNKQIAAAGLW